MTVQTGSTATIPDVERFLREIWSQVLSVDVKPDDNVLDLGGDSIAAAIGINRIRAKYDIELTVEALLLDRLTMRQLAAVIAAAER